MNRSSGCSGFHGDPVASALGDESICPLFGSCYSTASGELTDVWKYPLCGSGFSATLRMQSFELGGDVDQASLPICIEREPLLDALCEVRMVNDTPLMDILPSFLFHKLERKPFIKSLPAADIQQPMRANDAALRYTLTQRLDLGNFIVAVGNRSVTISCKLTYPK